MVSPTGSQVRSKLRPSQRLYKFRSPSHHKGWRLGSQQVRQNCIGVHGRCKTQRGHLQRKPKICSPANPGSSLHLTTTSRNGSGSRSLISLYVYVQYNYIICVACLICVFNLVYSRVHRGGGAMQTTRNGLHKNV